MKVITFFFSLLFVLGVLSKPDTKWSRTRCGPADQVTEWGAKVDPNNPLPEYPRPQQTRPDTTWKNLNGIWQWQEASGDNESPPFGKDLSGSILVPFPVESCLSGIGRNVKYMWYRLLFDKPDSFNASNVLLHFVAVDWQSKVWVNSQLFGTHSGGYDRFHYDVSDVLMNRNNELIVFVFDPSEDGIQPQGKQRIAAINGPGGDVYTPSSGIWGTVWIENVPETYISDVRIVADLKTVTLTAFTEPGATGPIQGWDNSGGDMMAPITLNTNDYYSGCFELCRNTSGCVAFSFGIPLCGGVNEPTCWLKSSVASQEQDDCRISGRLDGPVKVKYDVLDGTKVVASVTGNSGYPVTVTIPSPRLWTPDTPFLYNLVISINGDVVKSYFGMRTIGMGHFQHPGEDDTGPQNGIDRSGADMPGSPYTISNADPNICNTDCKNKPGCVAWAYAIPNCDGFGQPTCWLKSSRQGTSEQRCRVSGSMGYQPYMASRLILNGSPIFLAGWLDQSWWPDGQYTAPTDEALAFDLKAVKMFGLNSVRLHQKVNPERWYYYADTLGIVLMQDMIQKFGGATQASIAPFTVEYYRMVGNQYNHPSIVQWEVFNEGDCVGTFDVPRMIKIARDLDPTRLIDTNSGGPGNDIHIADVNDIHTYPYPGFPQPSFTQYGMIGEFGGIGAYVNGKEWVAGKCGTYLHVDTPQEEADTYVTMAQQILARKNDVSVSIYTQITDVELECDGFLNYDRTNKFNKDQTAAIATANQKLIRA